MPTCQQLSNTSIQQSHRTTTHLAGRAADSLGAAPDPPPPRPAPSPSGPATALSTAAASGAHRRTWSSRR
eukprot:2725645-Rhodomonas_salina.1